ncbi:hypothetical protein PC128_g7035 [Phytophthora cactorum]|nr:hypothetical protein PC128_g7035 [Phytophthora cactorum]
MVNAYITHKDACRLDDVTPLKRVERFKLLHKLLLQLTNEDFKTAAPSPSPMARKRRHKTPHTHKQLDDWVIGSGVQTRCQRACKCAPSIKGDAKCFLYPKARRGTDPTCFQVWHDGFECDASIPCHLGKRAVLRRAPKAAGVRKKTRREIVYEEKEES